MLRRALLSIGLAIGLLALWGCGAGDVATTVTEGSDQLSQASVSELTNQLPTIEEAVNAGKTDEAKAAFNTFIQTWDALKQQAQQAAPKSASQIETTMDSIKAALMDAEIPDPATVKDGLQQLGQQLNQLSAELQQS